MKRDKILYWIFTILISGLMLMSGIFNAMVNQASIDLISGQMGYPVYFIRLIGIAKILGVIAILIPGYPRLKEWAYAGMAFDLIAALYSSIAVAGVSSGLIFMILFIAVLAGSYIYYHKIKKPVL